MSLTICFLRHGETTASRAGGYCGTLDPDPTRAGYQMAIVHICPTPNSGLEKFLAMANSRPLP